MEPQTPKRRKLDANVEMPQARNEPQSDILASSIPMDSAVAQQQNGTVAGMKRSKSSSASAPFAGDAYNSSLFKLQVEEMLVEVKPNYAKRLGATGNALRKLKTLIEAIPDREQIPVSYCINFGIRSYMLNCYVVSRGDKISAEKPQDYRAFPRAKA
jgi:U3 small nucleolar RNA-associated protein 22